MESSESGGPGDQPRGSTAYPRFYLPIVFWLGLVMVGLGAVLRNGPALVAGALVMLWGLLLAVVAHWAQRKRARLRAERES